MNPKFRIPVIVLDEGSDINWTRADIWDVRSHLNRSTRGWGNKIGLFMKLKKKQKKKARGAGYSLGKRV